VPADDLDFGATYRLQLGPELTFAQARELVPYLRDLGISHLYLSPSLQARRGSTHGYDVVDPKRISEDLGGEEEFRRLASAADEAGMGIVLDIVPNHMATSEEENEYWRDPELRLKFFDVDPETGWYRRFFDVGDLAGVRQEDPEVFAATHEKVLQLVRDGLVEGLRIDHPDGLANPRAYLERLQGAGVGRIWVEKILEPGEELREDWPVEGTTGYEFANDVTALFVDPRGEEPLTRLYQELTGETRSYERLAHEAKLEQAGTTFVQEVALLRRLLDVAGLEEALASLHVYRTYVEPGRPPGEEDVFVVDEAGLAPEIARALLGPGQDEFTTRFQQTSGPVMAKGVEDTAFYRYLRLTALNEVGGNPGRFWLPVHDFHAGNVERARRFPRHLLASQTHDTKRSGDVRARIGALAGMAEEWREHVLRWRDANAELKHAGAPDGNEEYLIYQTLLGAWPIEPERLAGYLEKALREAKRNTNWLEPNGRWERGVQEFARALYDHRPFLESFEPFVERVARAGEHASLGALVLRLTVPGLPDVYQGDELESLSLVDPDNRRPVDWGRRRRILAELREGRPPARDELKLYVIWKALELRGRRPAPFGGSYESLEAGDDVCSFTRGGAIDVVVPLRPGGAASRDGNAIPLTPFVIAERP
jgi:(1->4)-alpha-D-glucan 1-alpha-D-glucosylmutase